MVEKDFTHLKGKFVISDGGPFLTNDNSWTDDPTLAATFATFQEALIAAHNVKAEDLNASNVFGPIQ